MIYLVFLGGVIVGSILGSIIMQIIVHHKTAHGYFRLDPLDEEPDFYTVHIDIEQTHLETKDRIILKKNNSQF